MLGAVRYPFPQTTDFSAQLLQAQASGAKVLGLANAGTDTVNSVKQAQEFGLPKRGMKIALMLGLPDRHPHHGPAGGAGAAADRELLLGPQRPHAGLLGRMKGKTGAFCPNQMNAGGYAATLHYLKACADMGAAQAKLSGRDTVARMKAMPTDDDCFGQGSIRADGRKLHPAYLFEVKRPEEIEGALRLLQAGRHHPAGRRPSGRWPRAAACWPERRRLAPERPAARARLAGLAQTRGSDAALGRGHLR